jgi:hypothetical protein
MVSPGRTRVHFMKHAFYELNRTLAANNTAIPVAFVKFASGRRTARAGPATKDKTGIIL